MYMITYLLPAILFVQFVIFAGVLLFCMHEWDIRTKSGIYLFISYVMALFTLAGIFVVVYFPFPIQQEEIALNIEYELGQTNNFVPFRSIFGYIKDFFSGYQSVFLFQCIGNILLFVPYGFFTAILSWKQKHKKKTVFIICFLTSLSIEILQGVFNSALGYCYRSVDVDDFLLNLLGGVIGSMAAEIVYKKWFGGKRTKIVMGVLVFMLLAVASPLTAKVSKADTPAATEKPIAREDTVEDWRDTGAFVKSGKYSYRVIDAAKKEIELRKIASDDTEIMIPQTIDGYKVVSLGYSGKILTNEVNLSVNRQFFTVLTNADKVTKITIPKTVTNIGVMAFYQCENLKKLYLPKDVLFVREYAFFGCSSLTELHLNDGVAMYNEAFADCTSLKKVYSKGFYSLSYESRLFSKPIEEWHLAQGEDKGIGYYSFWTNDFCKGSSKKFSIKKLYVDAKVKKVRLGIMQGDEKNPFFVKKIYIKGKKTKLTADKSMKTIVCTVKGAKAIRGAKKAHMTYSYKISRKVCIRKKAKKKKTYCVTMTYRSKKGKWIKHVKNVPTK